MRAVAAQLGIDQGDLPGLIVACRSWRGAGLATRGSAASRVGGGGCDATAFSRGGGRLWAASRFGRRGQQFLPVELAILLASRPGFQVLAANLADDHLFLRQVERAVADVQTLEFQQRFLLGALDGKGREADGELFQFQCGALLQAELVVGAGAQGAFLQVQWYGIAHIGPDGLELGVAEFQAARGGQWREADLALPLQLAAIGAGGHEGQLGIVIGQGAELVQAQIKAVVGELDGFTRALILEVQAAAVEGKAIEAQREGLASRLFGLGLAGWQLEQLGQVERAVLGEQQLGVWLVQFDTGQVHGAAPQTVPLQVDAQVLEAHLALCALTQLQAPQIELEGKGVELDALQAGGYGGVLRQLLVDDALTDPGQDQEAQQAVGAGGEGEGGEAALQSFGHGCVHFPDT